MVTKVDRPLLSMDSRQRVSAADYCAHREDYAEDEKTYWDLGMNDFMRKPINYEASVSRVDMWLEGHTQRVSMPPSDKVDEMRMLMGDEVLKAALEVPCMKRTHDINNYSLHWRPTIQTVPRRS